MREVTGLSSSRKETLPSKIAPKPLSSPKPTFQVLLGKEKDEKSFLCV